MFICGVWYCIPFAIRIIRYLFPLRRSFGSFVFALPGQVFTFLPVRDHEYYPRSHSANIQILISPSVLGDAPFHLSAVCSARGLLSLGSEYICTHVSYGREYQPLISGFPHHLLFRSYPSGSIHLCSRPPTNTKYIGSISRPCLSPRMFSTVVL